MWRRIRYWLTTVGFAGVCVAGFGFDVTWALNLAKFGVWFLFLGALLLLMAESRPPEGYIPPAPRGLDLTIDVALSLFIAATGAWVYAALYMMHIIGMQAFLDRK